MRASLFKRAKQIGPTDRMARLLDETLKMRVIMMSQNKIAWRGGVDAMKVSMFSGSICYDDAH